MNDSISTLTIQQFCEKYQIHASTYYRGVKSGAMPPYIKIGNVSRILISDETAWLEQQRQQSAA
jgi:predicted DNA-binding transcriptional regulator AlpA